MLRIAHISDTHVLSTAGAEWSKMLFNKRLTGYANLVLHRGRVHRREYLLAVLASVAAGADHVVVTGDITNLALESEYEEALALLDGVSRSVEVTVVPGNHDIYLPSIGRERRFPHHFRRFVQSDLPDLALDLPAGPYPCVKLRGPAAIIALSSAVPRPPFIAAGYLGDWQLAALARVLEHPEVARRMPVILVHHPPVDTRSCLARFRDGLLDAAALRNTLGSLSQGLVLFGHLHMRVRCLLRTATGVLDVIGASGAALDHTDPSVRAGFNRYDIGDDESLITVEAHVIDAPGITLRRTTIPRRTARA
jgi:3',5'-cyclic AMP phosphodiesterase CpdA